MFLVLCKGRDGKYKLISDGYRWAINTLDEAQVGWVKGHGRVRIDLLLELAWRFSLVSLYLIEMTTRKIAASS